MNRYDITKSNKQICLLAEVCHTGVFDKKWFVALETSHIPSQIIPVKKCLP